VQHTRDKKKTLHALGVLKTLGDLDSKPKKHKGRGGTTRNIQKKTLHALGVRGVLSFRHKKHKGGEVQHTLDEKKCYAHLEF